MVTLTPVLELEPGRYATRARSHPTKSGSEDPAGWDRFWRDCLADAGITDLTPWRPGSWLVPLDQFAASETLRKVLREELACVTDWRQEIGALAGGYVLQHEGAVVLPGCCGDLSNLADWTLASESSLSAWQQVWIGHPWTHVRADGETLFFAEPSEDDDVSLLTTAVSMPRRFLVDAIEEASQHRELFRGALTTVVREHAPPAAIDSVVEILLKGHTSGGTGG
ncbi:MAG: hypothetical protein AAGH15_09200 [Myxococcota bacterium]